MNITFDVIGHTLERRSLPSNPKLETGQIKTRKEWKKLCSEQGIQEKKVGFEDNVVIYLSSPTPTPKHVLGVENVKIEDDILHIQYAQIDVNPMSMASMESACSRVFIAINKGLNFKCIELDADHTFKLKARYPELKLLDDRCQADKRLWDKHWSWIFDYFDDRDFSLESNEKEPFKRFNEYEESCELTEDEKKDKKLAWHHRKYVFYKMRYQKRLKNNESAYKLCVKRLCGENIRGSR